MHDTPEGAGILLSRVRRIMSGKTVVCDDRTCVYGSYVRTNSGTAHQRLASAAGITPKFGGSIKADGSVGLKSESINATNYGRCDLAGTRAGNYVTSQINSGNIQSVQQYKSKR